MTHRFIWINACFIIIVFAALTGCESVSYYGKIFSGQMAILNKRQPIEELLVDPLTPKRLKTQLRRVLDIRQFAENELGLPVARQYLNFADLKRPFAVWNIYVAPEFSLMLRQWCHPVIGCASYRGYFSRNDAVNYAERAIEQGYDVFIGGVVAYSTLGWFDDPVLNTFIYRKDYKLAALIFHELAHHLLYVANDTAFNESFATLVEQEGLRRWLSQSGNPEAMRKYETDYSRRRQFIQLIEKYRRQLELLYTRHLSTADKRRAKSIIFDELRVEFKQIKAKWKGYSGYDAWFRHPLNNAQMASVSIYNDLVPAFAAILQENGNDLKLFYRTCQQLAKKPKEERRMVLDQYLTY